jgi:hypothetical protein
MNLPNATSDFESQAIPKIIVKITTNPYDARNAKAR